MIKRNMGYNYADLTIIPKSLTTIKSRSECNPFYYNGMLPIFTAPMSTVVNLDNAKDFIDNKITPIIPRNIALEDRLTTVANGFWTAFSLKEFEEYFVNRSSELKEGFTYKVCVDLANGHMGYLYELCTDAKNKADNYKLIIMTGNIANPGTYNYLCRLYDKNDNLVIDYIRLSIGSGSQCLTTSNVGIHYPIASLIDECSQTCLGYDRPKIIADGGIRNYSDVIKALALGADYVMIGGLFAGLYESASPLLDILHEETYTGITEDDKREQIASCDLFKECYGMSTKKAQQLIGKSNKTSEGKCSYIPVKYTIKQWTENMIDYLESAMSYCDAETLYDFIGEQTLIPNSIGELNAVNK